MDVAAPACARLTDDAMSAPLVTDGATCRRPRALRAVACAVLLATFAACTKVDMRPADSARTAGNPWTLHGVLRVAVTEEPNTLVRMFSNQSSADDVTALIFEPFFRYDDHGRAIPALARRFPTLANGLISPDGLRISFELQPSARWSDGVPVTADDVIFTWRAIMDGNNPVVRTAGYDKIKTIQADGPHRVTLVLKEPNSPLVYLFSEGSFPPLPAHLLARYKTLNNIPYDAAPIGDGPFVVKQWLHGSDIIFAANERYWRGAPRLREIDMKVIPNPNTQLQELRTHELDLLDGVSKPLTPQLAGMPGVRVLVQLQSNYRHLDFNTKNPILHDVDVRRAIARGIDVPKILADVYGGLGVQAVTDIPPFSWASNDLKPIPYDPAAARKLLDASGWRPGADGIRVRDGRRLALSISTAADNRPNADAETLIAQELKDIGIDLSIKNYAGAVLFAERGPIYGGTYDMAWIVDSNGVDPDDLAGFGCDWFPPQGANTTFYCNHKVDSYLRDAQLTYDRARRSRDYEQAWTIMLDEVPELMIYWDKNVSAANSDLRNFKPSPVISDYWNAWEWEI
jgi:peptide/nickel transport system substrate-binding protein